MKMRDPRQAIQFCEQFNPAHTKMVDIIKNIPDHRVRELWDMVVGSEFKEDPMPLVREMVDKIKQFREK